MPTLEKVKKKKNLITPYLTIIWGNRNSYPESLSKEMQWYRGEYYIKFKSSTSSSLHRETLPNMYKNGVAVTVF